MNLRFLAMVAVLTLSTAALADNQFERTLNVSSSPDLYVATGSGNIRIHPGTGTQVHIVGHVHAGWNAFGMRTVEEIIHQVVNNPPIAQDGNTIKIGLSGDKGKGISIDYDIDVPAAVALNLRSSSGDVTVDSGARYLSAATSSGNIRAHKINGPSDIGTASGDIQLDTESAAEIKLRSASGNIHVRGLASALSAHTASGDVIAELHLTGPVAVSTASGSVKLHLGPDARFNLEASTGSGGIHIHYPGAPEQDDHTRHHMTAPINGGGQPIELRTSSGDIEIGD